MFKKNEITPKGFLKLIPFFDTPFKIALFAVLISIVGTNLVGLAFFWVGIFDDFIPFFAIGLIVSFAIAFPIAYGIGRLVLDFRALNLQLQDELALAREIQQTLLPHPSPDWPGFDVICFSHPAYEVGGDFYTYRKFNNAHFGIAVGDVSGKGASAALLMATCLSLLNNLLGEDSSLEARLLQLHDAILPYTKPRRQNCGLCYVEFQRRQLKMVNAGGIPPYIRRVNGTVEWPEVGGFALGQDLGIALRYEEKTVPLSQGDFVILVSDGVVEAQNMHDAMLGFEQVEHLIRTGPIRNAQAMLKHLKSAIVSFMGETQLHDDVTIVVVQVL